MYIGNNNFGDESFDILKGGLSNSNLQKLDIRGCKFNKGDKDNFDKLQQSESEKSLMDTVLEKYSAKQKLNFVHQEDYADLKKAYLEEKESKIPPPLQSLSPRKLTYSWLVFTALSLSLNRFVCACVRRLIKI